MSVGRGMCIPSESGCVLVVHPHLPLGPSTQLNLMTYELSKPVFGILEKLGQHGPVLGG